ncbi:MAG: hypothetical protein WD294_16710 [Phycisphaeraceae bacterium]
MGIVRRTCSSHPDRAAIGQCVITKQPICAECSTRYEGVNYSREGLRLLHERRAKDAAGEGGSFVAVAATLATPALLFMMYLSYLLSFQFVIDLVGSG